MNRYNKLIRNTGLVAVGTFGSKLLTFIMVRFYTECLTEAEYSTADLLLQTAKLLIPVLCLGITETVFRFALDRDCKPKEVFTSGLCTIFIGEILFAAVIPLLFSVEFFRQYVWLIVAYITCSNLHALTTQYVRSKDHYSFYALQGIINTALTIVFNIFFLLVFKIGVTGYILSVVLADFISFLLVFIKEKLWNDIISPFKIRKSTFVSMLRYSIPLIPTTVFWWITSSSDHYMVKFFSGDVVNGLYTASYKIPSLLIMLCTIFIQAWNFSAVTEKSEKSRVTFFGKVFDIYQALLFIACAGIILLCKPIARIMFAESYYGSWLYIPLLSLATIFSCFVSFIGSVYTVKKKSVFSFVTAMVGAVVNILLNLILIPSSASIASMHWLPKAFASLPFAGLGALGAAVATFFSYFVVFIIRAVNIRAYVPFKMHPIKLGVAGVLCALMTLIVMAEVPLWYIWNFLIFAFIVLINLRPIAAGIRKILHRGEKDTKTVE